MADGLPVFRLHVGITRGPEHRRRKKEQDDDDGQRKNDNREDQQLLVSRNNRKRTLQQQPASLNFIHLVHRISFLRDKSRAPFFERSVALRLQERSFLQFQERLLELFLRVH